MPGFLINPVHHLTIRTLVIVTLAADKGSDSVNSFILWPKFRTMQRLSGRFDSRQAVICILSSL